MKKIDSIYWRYANAFAPAPAQIRQYITDLLAVGDMKTEHLCALTGLPPHTIRDLLQDPPPVLIQLSWSRVIWLLWCLIAPQPTPHPLSDLKSIATWGHLKDPHGKANFVSIPINLPAPAVSCYVTMRDVAEKAGVDIVTVSRTFRDSPLIATETKAQILLLAKQMGYDPNQPLSVASRTLGTRNKRNPNLKTTTKTAQVAAAALLRPIKKKIWHDLSRIDRPPWLLPNNRSNHSRLVSIRRHLGPKFWSTLLNAFGLRSHTIADLPPLVRQHCLDFFWGSIRIGAKSLHMNLPIYDQDLLPTPNDQHRPL